ncbi:TetR/AcrR family transcriptional regulator [Pseudofrankia inefficax]|uniref:Regulatory protein TetR n=1 Tax=Pseudofrankia inefficax (strain DSM 45817 / CECT 9037 / DDB 130130 / EuI1c) TaxID=298654 RepID=E3IV17_PSEI1|nr:TetR/AcrR family transcriptional regulator [Pseudofrankia inefficax]ADP80037.1 regulatory protein TetR [Pseudofrankia inefficax]
MPSQSPRRSQVERRTRSEDALLDAAAEMIADRGVDRASLASIGDRAGVSRGLPTHLFGSKDTLVARLAARAQERIAAHSLATLDRQSRRAEELSGLEMVLLTVDCYLDLFEKPGFDERAFLVMWGSLFPASSSVQGMAEAERHSYDSLSDVITSGQRDGSIRADVDPITSAVLVLGLMRGVAGLQLAGTAVVDMARVRDTCAGWIVSSLATGQGAAATGHDRAPTSTFPSLGVVPDSH